jgi:hypothetical protein
MLFGKGEVAYIALKPMDRGLVRNVRHSAFKGLRIATKDGGGEVEFEFAIAKGQALYQPGAEKPCASGDEKATSPGVLPYLAGVAENMLKIFRRQGFHASSINPPVTILSHK